VERSRRLTVPRRVTRPRHGRFSRYAAPLAFLLAVTIAVVLVASAIDGPDDTNGTTSAAATATAGKKPAKKPAKKKKVQPARYYVVAAGDTFEVIAGKTGVTVGRIEALNPGVSSTSLHVGQKLRVG